MKFEDKKQDKINPDHYKEIMKDQEVLGPGYELERSQFFRHKYQYEIFDNELDKKLKEKDQVNFLTIGIGNLEEPLSFLSVAEKHAQEQEQNIQDILDLKMVDIRDKDEIKTEKNLGKDAFGNIREPDQAYKKSFDIIKTGKNKGEYQFNDNITTYISKKFNDPNKTKLNTPVEEFLNEHGNKKYDFVACNNVLQWLGYNYDNPLKSGAENKKEKNFQEFYQNIKKITDLVEPNGLLFIELPKSNMLKIINKVPEFKDKFEKIKKFTYRRKLTEQEKLLAKTKPDKEIKKTN